jgi:hypothetical protein
MVSPLAFSGKFTCHAFTVNDVHYCPVFPVAMIKVMVRGLEKFAFDAMAFDKIDHPF